MITRKYFLITITRKDSNGLPQVKRILERALFRRRKRNLGRINTFNVNTQDFTGLTLVMPGKNVIVKTEPITASQLADLLKMPEFQRPNI